MASTCIHVYLDQLAISPSPRSRQKLSLMACIREIIPLNFTFYFISASPSGILPKIVLLVPLFSDFGKSNLILLNIFVYLGNLKKKDFSWFVLNN